MTKRSCVHHWKIAAPDGRAKLPARCKKCGRTRTFSAVGEGYKIVASLPRKGAES